MSYGPTSQYFQVNVNSTNRTITLVPIGSASIGTTTLPFVSTNAFSEFVYSRAGIGGYINVISDSASTTNSNATVYLGTSNTSIPTSTNPGDLLLQSSQNPTYSALAAGISFGAGFNATASNLTGGNAGTITFNGSGSGLTGTVQSNAGNMILVTFASAGVGGSTTVNQAAGNGGSITLVTGGSAGNGGNMNFGSGSQTFFAGSGGSLTLITVGNAGSGGNSADGQAGAGGSIVLLQVGNAGDAGTSQISSSLAASSGGSISLTVGRCGNGSSSVLGNGGNGGSLNISFGASGGTGKLGGNGGGGGGGFVSGNGGNAGSLNIGAGGDGGTAANTTAGSGGNAFAITIQGGGSAGTLSHLPTSAGGNGSVVSLGGGGAGNGTGGNGANLTMGGGGNGGAATGVNGNGASITLNGDGTTSTATLATTGAILTLNGGMRGGTVTINAGTSATGATAIFNIASCSFFQNPVSGANPASLYLSSSNSPFAFSPAADNSCYLGMDTTNFVTTGANQRWKAVCANNVSTANLSVYGGGTNTITGSLTVTGTIQANIYKYTVTSTVLSGFDLAVPSATVGNIATISIVTSDERLKQDIVDTDLGLNFIEKIRAVKFHSLEDTSKYIYGFLAQDINAVIDELNVVDADICPMTNTGYYAFKSRELLSPMVKAIQELSQQNKQLQAQNDSMMVRLAALEAKLNS